MRDKRWRNCKISCWSINYRTYSILNTPYKFSSSYYPKAY